jgi:ABC-type molybdate transport system substrate-binding protein
MNETKLTAAVVGLTVMLATHVPVGAAEITVISSNALKTTLEQLAPAFEKATEHKLAFTWALPFR